MFESKKSAQVFAEGMQLSHSKELSRMKSKRYAAHNTKIILQDKEIGTFFEYTIHMTIKGELVR